MVQRRESVLWGHCKGLVLRFVLGLQGYPQHEMLVLGLNQRNAPMQMVSYSGGI